MILVNTHIKNGQLLERPLRELHIEFKNGDIYVETNIDDINLLRKRLEIELDNIREERRIENQELLNIVRKNKAIIDIINKALE